MSARVSWSRHGDGPPLMMIHGGLVDSRSWDLQLPLADELSLVMMDTRGFGQSWPMGLPRSMADLVEDVVGILDAESIDEAFVLGFSIGGMIAQAVAVSHPDRVRGLILESTRIAPSRMDQGDRSGASPGVPSVNQHVERAFSASYRATHPQFVEAYTAMAAENHARRVMPALVAAMADAPRSEELASLDLATLVVHGVDDAAMPFARAERLASAIPNATLVPLECGHSLHIERSEEFNALLAGWVGRVANGTCHDR